MDFLRRFFENEKIEYYSVLPYLACRETAPHIMKREAFMPRSVVIFLIPYYAGETENLSRYSAARDYHIFIKEITDRLSSEIKTRFPNASAKGYGDHSPIDERAAALSAGLGVLGENGLLINEKYGSYVFIADLVTDLPPELFGDFSPSELKKCEGCGKCLKACPTGVLRAEGTDCLSAITQKKGELSAEEAALMRKYNTAWGCDICQSVCPHNEAPLLTPIPFFHENRIESLTKSALAEMSDEEFSTRAFAWRGRKTVERNVEILSEK